jgi:hypothetical protein
VIEHLDLVLVDVAQQLPGEHLPRRALGADPARGKHAGAIRVRRGQPQIVQDHDDGRAVGCTLPYRPQHQLLMPQVERRRRLVEQQHRCALSQHPGQRRPRLLAAGQRRELPGREPGRLGQPHGLDDRVLVVRALRPTAPTVENGDVSFDALAVTLTAAGASAFAGFYQAGTALDPVTASASDQESTDPTDPTDPTGPTDPGPGNGSAAQTIKAAVSGGALTLTSAGQSVSLSAATPGQTATGALNAVTVSDLRGTNAGWDLVGQVTEFKSTGGGVIPAANLGWTPTAQAATGGLVAAAGVQNAVAPGAPVAPGVGLGASRTLCSAETGSSLGSATCGAALNLGIPESSAAGEYSAVLTLTLA